MPTLPMIPLWAGSYSGVARALDDATAVALEAQDHADRTRPATPAPEGARSGGIIELLNASAGVAQPAHMPPRQCDRSVIPAETSSG